MTWQCIATQKNLRSTMMNSMIEISDETKIIIKKLISIADTRIDFPIEFNLDNLDNVVLIDKLTAINWLTKKQSVDKVQRFLLESLYTSVLNDLSTALSTGIKNDSEKKSVTWFAWVKFLALAVAGTLFFGCEGFDGITAILGITALPTLVIFIAGIIFSVLSIMVFFAFDLLEISKNLGISVKNAPKMVDTYLEQINIIKSLRKKIRASFLNNTAEELRVNIALLQMLQEKHDGLKDVRDALKKSLNNPFLNIAKLATASITGIIFFSGGFFAGQTVALAIAGFFTAAILPTAWPIILVSILVGLAALSVYWFVERPGVENLIGRLVGLDEEKIEQLCDELVVAKEQNKLQELQKTLENALEKQRQYDAAALEITALQEALKNQETPTMVNAKTDTTTKISDDYPQSAVSFFKMENALYSDSGQMQQNEHDSGKTPACFA